jgi:hypothetical protein
VTLTFDAEPKGRAFHELLHVFVGRAGSGGLVLDDPSPRAETQELLAALGSKALREEETRRWPGSEVPEWAPASVLYTFSYDADVAEILFAHCPELFGWQQCRLPCNFHLRAPDGSVLLGSLTAEDDAWVELSPKEWRALVDETQELRHVPVRED